MVILEELGGETYRCLQDGLVNTPLMDDNTEVKEEVESTDMVEINEEVKYGKRRDVRRYLEVLKQEKSFFLDGLKENEPKYTGIVESLPGVLRTEDQEEKWAPKWEIVKDNMIKSLHAGDSQL